MYEYNIEGNSSVVIKLRLSKQQIHEAPFNSLFDEVFETRIKEADDFFAEVTTATDKESMNIQRQAFAGMLWSKQYFNIDIPRWLKGDPGNPPPPEARKQGRNHQWLSLNNEGHNFNARQVGVSLVCRLGPGISLCAVKHG